MISPSDPLEASVRALRETTSAPATAAATRSRVLDQVAHAQVVRVARRRTALIVGVALLSMGSGAAAWSAIDGRLHFLAPSPLTLSLASGAQTSPPPAPRTPRPRLLARVIPPLSAIPTPAPSPDSAVSPSVIVDEASAYATAHRAHFGNQPPATALRAWERYLRHFPNGVLAPEARYNRAICLLRLGRRDDAAAALHEVLAGGPEGYRRQEARRLLDWLGRE